MLNDEASAALLILLCQMIEGDRALIIALNEALSAHADGVILLDTAGRPGYLSDAARRIVAADDGLAIADGVLFARRLPERRRLARLVAQVLAGPTGPCAGGGHLLVSRPSGAHPYVVSVTPGRSPGRCAVLIHAPGETRAPSRAVLREAYGLTPREADLAVQLAGAARLAEAAASSGMAPNTARNHLRSLFMKMETRSQPAIARLLARLS